VFPTITILKDALILITASEILSSRLIIEGCSAELNSLSQSRRNQILVQNSVR